MNFCTLDFPGDTGYFIAGGLGAANNLNQLWGDYFYVNNAENFAQGETLVHLEASGALGAGNYTYYRRYSGGSDQREGMGSHWEMWAFVMGGMSPMQAIKAATIDPARYMGMSRDIGSIEAGKLADLLIVDGNPLQDIRVTDDIAYVVLNGRIYEGGSMNEHVTGDHKLAPFYWQH